MKRKKLLVGLFSFLGMATLSNGLFAQTNLGANCGCPPLSQRTPAVITNVGTWVNLPSAAYGKELTSGNVILTCDKIWSLDEKLYIGSGATITIEPGTVIKGSTAPSLAAARALIIERGGKIMAPGTEECPIVFTHTDDNLDGLYPLNNKGKWGGVLLCGKATNNLTLAANGPFVPGQGGKMAVADGLGVLEGFASSYPQDQFGVALSVPAGTVLSTSPSNTYTFGLPSTSAAPASGCNGLGNTKIELNANAPAYVVQGQTVSGAGIPTGTTILSITAKQLTLSAALTAAIATNAEITFSGTYPNGGQTGYFTTMTYVAPSSGAAPVSGTTGTVASYVGAYYTSTGTFDDNDNSGVMTYVSIRHSGANLLVGSEINGLTLASVGRGTKIEHIEIVSCADDNIEIFGGTVDLKYCTTIFGNDDMYDYDLGWTGRAQFLFGMKSNQASGVSIDNDNGFENDGGDGNVLANLSNPTIYNATILGNEKTAGTADNRAVAAMNFKEAAKGTLNNSVFSKFNNGLNLEAVAVGTGPNKTIHNAYHYWASQTTATANSAIAALDSISVSAPNSLKVKCNTFIGITNPIVFGASSLGSVGTVNAPMTTQFGVDGNLTMTESAANQAGFNSAFTFGSAPTTSNEFTAINDVVPNTGVTQFQLGSTCPQAPQDGFFSYANYRGAFAPSNTNESWLSDWSYSQILGTSLGLTVCPTDLNHDGITNTADFLIFAPAFGTSCN
jgi:hypothetical protein